MKLRPLGDRVVIKLLEVKEETDSGILLGSGKEEPKMAEVLAIGPAILNDDKRKDSLKVGDKVVFSQYAGSQVELDDEEYTVLGFNDILAVVE